MTIRPINISLKALKSRWFQKSFFWQAGSFLIFLVIIFWGIRYTLHSSLKQGQLLEELDLTLFFFAIGTYLCALAFSLWGSINIIRPLTEILIKVENLRKFHNRTASFDKDQKQLSESESDEWDWLQKSLDQVHHDMEKTFGEMAVENRKMSTLLESLSDSIIALDKEQKIIFANNQFQKNFIPHDLRHFNMSEFKILEIIGNKDIDDIFYRTISLGENTRRRNLELSARGGLEKHFYDLSINPLKDFQDKMIGAVFVFHDVTDRKLAEQMREDFVSNVSHEVRTPLTAMKGYVQILKENRDKIPSTEQSYLDKIESNADRLNLLFQDILTLSLIESETTLHREIINFQELTENAILNIKQSFRNKMIDVKCSYEIKEGEANPGMMEQVLTNLVVNAFKYSLEKRNINIRWKNFVPFSQEEKTISSSWFCLEVEDEGMGIAKEHMPRLFERFYRVDHSRSREMGGTGLGLSIVKHIAQNHLGKVSVKSKVGKGSLFTVFIPNLKS